MQRPFNKSDWRRFFGQLPVWAIVLWVGMLTVRFVILAIMHWW